MGFPSETEMDSAVSLRGKRGRVTVSCVIRSWCWRWASWCVPGRDAAGDGLVMASKLCSLCLNTSLGLNDRWEISDLASCSESKQQQSQWVFHTRQGSLNHLVITHTHVGFLHRWSRTDTFLVGFVFLLLLKHRGVVYLNNFIQFLTTFILIS